MLRGVCTSKGCLKFRLFIGEVFAAIGSSDRKIPTDNTQHGVMDTFFVTQRKPSIKIYLTVTRIPQRKKSNTLLIRKQNSPLCECSSFSSLLTASVVSWIRTFGPQNSINRWRRFVWNPVNEFRLVDVVIMLFKVAPLLIQAHCHNFYGFLDRLRNFGKNIEMSFSSFDWNSCNIHSNVLQCIFVHRVLLLKIFQKCRGTGHSTTEQGLEQFILVLKVKKVPFGTIGF